MVVRFRRSLLEFVLFVVLVLMAGSGWLVITPLPPDWAEWLVRTVSVVCFLFYAAFALYFVRMLERPALVIDSDGFIDQTDFRGIGRVRWREISSLRMVTVWPMKFIIIKAHDPRRFIDRGNLAQRWVKAMQMFRFQLGFANIMLDADFDELMATLRRFFDRAEDGRVSPRPE
jgi:hypothetical protein